MDARCVGRHAHRAAPCAPLVSQADAARQTRRTGRGPGACRGYRVSRRLVSTGSRKPAHVAVLALIVMMRPAQAVRATSRKRSLPAALRHPALPPAWRMSSTCVRGKRWCRTRAPDICTKLCVEFSNGMPVFVTRCVRYERQQRGRSILVVHMPGGAPRPIPGGGPMPGGGPPIPATALVVSFCMAEARGRRKDKRKMRG